MNPSNAAKHLIPQELVDLRKEIDLLPRSVREQMQPLSDKLMHYIRLQNRLVRIAQDAVDQLQLDVKYLAFDLDVTRQERDALRAEKENL